MRNAHTHTHTHTHKRTRSSRHGARRIQGRREGEMIVVCVWRIGSKGEKEGGEKERMEDDRRGRGARVLNHCVLGDYFPRSLSHTHTHTHTQLQVVHRLVHCAAVSLRFSGSTFSLQNAFLCYTTTTTTSHPHPHPQPLPPSTPPPHQRNHNTSKQ